MTLYLIAGILMGMGVAILIGLISFLLFLHFA
jgi:hypothetical protein